MKRKLISIITPCYNEEANVQELYSQVKDVIRNYKNYDFEFIFIDNKSIDNTVSILKSIAAKDPTVKIIVNTRNFGHVRSPYYGILQASGDSAIYLASDLQDPPRLIAEFIQYWESGYKLVMGIKPQSESNLLFHLMRKTYYRFLNNISDIEVINDSTGFGLYDKDVIDWLRKINDPYPFLRGLICELGFEIKTIPFIQPGRKAGLTKNNFFTLYDFAVLGVISHSKTPIRIATISGFILGSLSLIIAALYIILKFLFWDKYPVGFAPIVIGLFFLLGIQLLFIGILGEYISSIHTYVQNRPIVVEKERVNFD